MPPLRACRGADASYRSFGQQRDGRLVPWLAVAKALAACLFFASFFTSGLYWMAWTPGRYVYQLFVWGEETKVGLFALAFLGRGTFNTLNAFYFTRPWWGPLRVRRPLLGRAVTALPIGVAALCTWAFLGLVREEVKPFSPDAQAVARIVAADYRVTVDQVRAALAYAAHVVSLERIVAVPRGREPAGGAAELLRAAGHDAVAVYHDACSQPPYATSSGLSGPPTIPTAHAIPPAK